MRRIRRFQAWLRRPLLCKFGFHVWSINEWGFGGAVIDWYCARGRRLRCQKYIGFTALDDCSEEMKAAIEKRAGRSLFDGGVQFES